MEVKREDREVFVCFLFLMISSTSDLSFFISLNPLAATSKNFQEESIVPHWMDMIYVHTESFILYAMKYGRVLWHECTSLHKNVFLFSKITGLL